MLFQVDTRSMVPIHDQIVNQVVFGIASGSLAMGELIPSIRELAITVEAHPNTVAKAYQKLETLGLITARRGKGMEVTPDAPAICRQRRGDILRERLRDVLREALLAVGADDVRRLVEEELSRQAGGGT